MEYYVSSVIGVNHQQRGCPCQDAYRVLNDKQPVVMAIADGHGGEAYCRSDIGASIACSSAVEMAQTTDFFDLPSAIKRHYDLQVQKHLEENPLNEDEKSLLGENVPAVAYGATLLLAVINDDKVQVLQLGDGEIHVLGPNGTFLRSLEEDEDCFNNFTSSLCYTDEEALKHFRLLQYDEKPAAIFMFSDGYKSPYSRPYKLARAVVKNEDISTVAKAGEHGDDQTILIAYDRELIDTDTFNIGFEKTIDDCNTEIIYLQIKAQRDKIKQETCAIEEFLVLAKERIEKFKEKGEMDRVEALEELSEKKKQMLILLRERLNELCENSD